MSIVLRGLCRFLIKFCWIIVIIAIIFGAVGYFTKTERKSTVENQYISSVKLIVDIKDLENGTDSNEFFTGYNTAYSLFPTYKDILFAKTTVLERIKNEYYVLTNEEITVDDLKSAYSFSFPENALSFTLSCKTDSQDKSAILIDLICKYGVSRLNEISAVIKVEISSTTVVINTVELKGSEYAVNAYKEKIEESKPDIYSAAVAAIDSEYVQREQIQSGFSLKESDNGVILSFEGNSLKINEFVIDYVTNESFIEGLEIVKVNNPDIKYLKDVYSSVESNTVVTPAVDNTITLALLGVFAAGIVLCLIYLLRCEELKKNVKKESADENSAQK